MDANRPTRKRRAGIYALVLSASLLLTIWGVWALVASFPDSNAQQVARAALLLAGPGTGAVDPPGPPATPTNTRVSLLGPPTATEDAGNTEQPPTVPADVGPAQTSTAVAGGTPTTLAEDTVTPQETAIPIFRQAQFSYPIKMEIGREAVVRFTIFTEGNEPLPQVDKATPTTPFTMPTLPDLRPRITVDLEVAGAEITRENIEKRSQDLTAFNSWEWSVRVAESRDVILRPHVFIDYVDPEGKLLVLSNSSQVEALDTSYVIVASDVVDNVAAEVMGGWFNANLLGVLAVVLGLPGTIISWRELFGRRRISGATMPAG